MTEGRLIAGFDAGQTHTTCRLALLRGSGDGDGHGETEDVLTVLGEGEGPGVSHLAAPGGEERFGVALVTSLMRASIASGLGRGTSELAAAAVGASGIEVGTAVQEQGWRRAAKALGLPAEQVSVTGDERTALQGAFGGDPGIIVISGTGCIALGRDAAGREHRCGGWGWLLDRAGSACDIGRDALALALEMADGRHQETKLRAELWSALSIPESVTQAAAPAAEPDPITAQRIKAMVVDPRFGAAGFARLAPTVEALAAAGDPDALTVLEHSAEALVALVRGVACALELADAPVCCLGGALTHLPTFAAAYRLRLQEELPGLRPMTARGDGCQGALLLAAELLAPEQLATRRLRQRD